jgi:hypothetical protein
MRIPFTLLRYLPILLTTGLLLLLPTACSSVEYPPDKEPRMVVAQEQVPFYVHGPAQGNGADRLLAKGDEVHVLSKDFGFSLVQAIDGQKGYVANDSLVPAPPEPSPTPTPTHQDATKQDGDSPRSQEPLLPDPAPLVSPEFRY